MIPFQVKEDSELLVEKNRLADNNNGEIQSSILRIVLLYKRMAGGWIIQ